MADTRHSGRTPGLGTVVGGALGAGGGLLVAALWIRSGAWVTERSSGDEGPAVLAVVIGMTGIVCAAEVWYLGLSVPYVLGTQMLHVLMVMPLAFYGDAVLDRRGEQVTAVVTDLRTTESTHTDYTGHHCRVRLPDGTEPEVFGPGCDGDTTVGDRLTVYWDPEGRVPTKLEVHVTDEQRTWVVRVSVAGFVALGARIGVHVGRGRGPLDETP